MLQHDSCAVPTPHPLLPCCMQWFRKQETQLQQVYKARTMRGGKLQQAYVTWSVEEARRDPSDRAPSCSPSDSPCLLAVASNRDVPPSCHTPHSLRCISIIPAQQALKCGPRSGSHMHLDCIGTLLNGLASKAGKHASSMSIFDLGKAFYV